MPSTALPALKTAVLEILGETPGLEGVTITDDKEPERAKEYIWLYRAKAVRDWASIGTKAKDEMPKVFLRIAAILGGKSGAASESRVFELAEIVEEALDDHVTLNGAVRFHLIEDIEEEKQLFDTTWGAHVLMTLSAKARI
jgi:hypothetical protein